MIYTVKCPNCGERDLYASMKDAAEFMPCPVCERPRPQKFHVPYHQEDRIHMWKGPMGNGYSTALGAQMPSSRSERDRMARERGVEFCSKAELLADNKEAAEAVAYTQHVQEGGAREQWSPPATDAFVAKPKWAEGLT